MKKISSLVVASLLAFPAVAESYQDGFTAAEHFMDCIIEPNKSLDIASPVEGVVAEVFVERGDRVKAGQVLMQLESGVEQVVLDLAKTRAEFARRTMNRNDNVSEVMSSQEKDEIITDAKIAELEVKEAEMRLDMKKIRSPIDGLVIEELRSQGEFVSAEPVFSIISIDPLYVEVIAPVAVFGSTRVGSEAIVIPEAPIGGRYQAKITRVDPVIDSASGTFMIRLEIPNPESRLPSGLKCSVDFSG